MARPAFSWWLVLAVLVFASVRSAAEPVDPAVTMPDGYCPFLTDALESALKQSPTMLVRNIGLARAEAIKLERDSIRWPSIGGSGRYQISTLSATNAKSSTTNGLLYNLDLRQPLFRWGEISHTLEIDRLDLMLNQKQFAEAYRDLASTLRTQFLQLIVKKRDLANTRFNVGLLEKANLANEVKVKSGQISNGEFAAGELALEEGRIGLKAAELQYDAAKKLLARLSGLPSVTDDRIPDDLPAPVLQNDQALRLVEAFNQKDQGRTTPTAMSKVYIIRQAELRYKIARARLLPKVDFNAGLSQENTTNLANQAVKQYETNQKVVGVLGNWNIFDGLATRGAKREALAEKREAEQDLDSYLKSLTDQQQSQIAYLELSARTLALAERKLEMSKGGLAFTEEEFKQGRRSEEQVSQVKSSHLAFELTVLRARADVFTRWSDLVSLLWLDPALQKLPASYLSHGK